MSDSSELALHSERRWNMQHDLKAKKFIVITSINPLSRALEAYASLSRWKLILVGDRKGPKEIKDDRIVFLDIDKQAELGFAYHSTCPENHYARKNIGYLYAIAHGAEVIAESDDDNMPKEEWGKDISFSFDDLEVEDNTVFFNAYSKFCDSMVWPRGFPLGKILAPCKPRSRRRQVDIGVWQQLADNDPDVDAIYRLTRSEPVLFKTRDNFALARHVYCPFNSQNTFWSRKAFPFMYLPKSVTSRFTDILRGYIAQRLLWEENLLLGFGGASVWQDRNPHDLMQDFSDEVPMYLNVVPIVERLESLRFSESPLGNLHRAYQVLVDDHVVAECELKALEGWMGDLRTYGFE